VKDHAIPMVVKIFCVLLEMHFGSGVDAPIDQKSIFQNVQKFRKKNLGVHLDILCPLTKFCQKMIFFVAYVIKTIFGAPK
jgi:hypothetical protein